MIINPKDIEGRKIIENLEGGSFEVQQNGIDLTVDSVEMVMGGRLGNHERLINDYAPVLVDLGGYWNLDPGCYSIMFQQKIKVPENMCAQIIQRSTLNRMGGFILSGLYDSGFKNQIGAILRVSAPIRLERGARVAQIIFEDAEPASLYSGIYQGK